MTLEIQNSVRKWTLFFLIIPWVVTFTAREGLALSPSDLIIVYNLSMAESRQVAEHYAEKRGVPSTNLVGVRVSESEIMSRSDLEKNLIPPVRTTVQKLKDEKRQPAILLVYGIPLIVQDAEREKSDGAFMASLEEKIKEYSNLTLQLSSELDNLTGQRNPPPPKPNGEAKSNTPPDILLKAGESFARGDRYLQNSGMNKDITGSNASVASLLIRLGGSSPAVKALIGGLSKKQKKERRTILSQELFKWDALLRTELLERSFLGTLPEKALETATLIRFIDGILGELRFWDELKNIYKAGQKSASVDSELPLILAGPYQQVNWLPNPFHDRYEKIPFIKRLRENTIKVARLDGPTPALAKRLVDDALEIETTGLKGIFYIDARGLTDKGNSDAYTLYDRHLINLYDLIKDKTTMEVVIDRRPELFPPGACPDAALYCGWYSLRNYVDAFQWQKGAVGFHVASGEASTLRQKFANVWCKRMIEEGVAATLGPVQEPYLSSFPLPDHFFPLLMTGSVPILDVYFRTTPFISWRQTFIGDPLYNPFKANPAFQDLKK